MNFYSSEIYRIKSICFFNEAQLKTVIKVKKLINNNFEQDVNLEFLAHTASTSKFHLIRLFKKYYGTTPKQHLISKRLEKSKELLTEGYSVIDTCYFIGFNSPSSFSRLFKEKTGKSPTRFQKEQF
ncbi:Transcriptional regulator, AraC family [Tenacibaculum discolor]